MNKNECRKVSNGVSINEKDNNRYMKSNTGLIDVEKQNVGNSFNSVK